MALQAHLVELERKHKILENELHEALVHLSTDDLQIVELKRRKLMVKDQIERLRHTGSEHAALVSFPTEYRDRNFIAGWALTRSYAEVLSSRANVFEATIARRCVFADSQTYRFTSPPTWSAIASDDVSPGDSIPNRLISPATP